MPTGSIKKEEAKRIIDALPDEFAWEDLMHEIYVRSAIEAGLSDSEAGRGIPTSEVRKRYGLPE
jgi:predicted transcriptional regulator